MVLKSVLHWQMTEKIAFEVITKTGKNHQKLFLNVFFTTSKNVRLSFFLSHMKFKSKISYTGKKISILPRKITEKLAVKVYV